MFAEAARRNNNSKIAAQNAETKNLNKSNNNIFAKSFNYVLCILKQYILVPDTNVTSSSE